MARNSRISSSDNGNGSAADAAAWKQRLLDERRDLDERLRDGHSPASPPEAHLQPADKPVDAITRDVEFKHREALHLRLQVVNDALHRLESGSFGVCESCGAEIDPRRLAHDPALSLCIACQSAAEQNRRTPTL